MKEMECLRINNEQLAIIRQEINHLILVSNMNEAKLLIQNLKPAKNIFNNQYNDKILLYESESIQNYYIGCIEKTLVVATILSEMGGIKTNAATLVAVEAINLFEPKFATIVGICASLNQKVKIGDVVIANPITSYDSKKETGDKRIYRGQRFYPYKLLNRFDYAKLSAFRTFKVYKGEVVSGETLSNSEAFRAEMIHDFPETLALDMEGLGFATACVKMNVNWLFIKGVSDDGYNKTDDFQQLAAANAFEVAKLLYQSELHSKLLKSKSSRSKSVFISGALYWDNKKEKPAKQCAFARILSKKLLKNGYRLVTALGRIVGDEILTATYEHLFVEMGTTENLLQNAISNDYLMTIPFPYEVFCGKGKQNKSAQYVNLQRQFLIKECSIAIFIYGNKKEDDTKYKNSDGMLKEFEIAKKMNCLIVPVGATDNAALDIYNECEKNFEKIYGSFVETNQLKELRAKFNLLKASAIETPQDQEKLANSVMEFIEFAISH